jgi:bloom syndrome protein
MENNISEILKSLTHLESFSFNNPQKTISKKEKTWDFLKDSNDFDFENSAERSNELTSSPRIAQKSLEEYSEKSRESFTEIQVRKAEQVDLHPGFGDTEWKVGKGSKGKSEKEKVEKFVKIGELLSRFDQKVAHRDEKQGNEDTWHSGFDWDNEIELANREVFGNQSFREKQREVINATKSKRDVIALIPTGGGKSLTFQLSAVTEEGVTLVVMPLLSLISDQMQQMEDLGVECKFLHTPNDLMEVFSMLAEGRLSARLLFVTPEKITQSGQARSLIDNLYMERKIERFVIDEVHWVSSWGQDFRPDYLKLSVLKENYPDVPILGLTATATNQVKADITKLLKLRNVLYFQSSFNRPNLFYEIRSLNKSKWEEDIATFCKSQIDQGHNSGIIYCIKKKETEDMASFLRNKYKINCTHFHANLSLDKRNEVQKKWMDNKIQIIVATIAFGMGINKKDVRFVIHVGFPKSIESYIQEWGRAGRDSKPAQWILYYNYGDRKLLDWFIMNNSTTSSNERKEENMHNLYKMIDYLEESILWRRKLQLSLLGESFKTRDCK